MTLQTNPHSPSGQLVDDENDAWYINGDIKMLTEHNRGEPDCHWVSAEAFMEMQAERDMLRRTLAMINGIRVRDPHDTPDYEHDLLDIGRFCDLAGFTEVQGRAHNSLMRDVASEGG